MTESVERPWEQLEELLENESIDEVQAFVVALPPGDAARCVNRLNSEQRDAVISMLSAEAAAELLESLPEVSGSELLEHADPKKAAAILEELSSDDQADLITHLEPESVASILSEMDPEAAESARELAQYPADSAGGLMVREYLFYRQDVTAQAVISDLRARIDEVSDYEIQYIYVTDRVGRLVGVLRLRDLLLTGNERPIQAIMIHDPVSVPVSMALDELADLLEERSYLGVPVVDEGGRLVGVVHRSDMDYAWENRAEGARLKQQGIVGGEELRSMPVMRRSRRRLAWLSVNILLNVLAASVIAGYQDTLSAVIALTVFLPMISDMSGCSGNQAVAVSMRELTLGVIRPMDVFYVWRKEVVVGVINGVALGLLIGLTAWAWKGIPMLGVVVGAALALNTVVAVSIGGAVPLLLKRFGMDPALASGPILTTLTDMCGFFLVLSFAAASMDYLVPAT